jgi:hypothetical protein
VAGSNLCSANSSAAQITDQRPGQTPQVAVDQQPWPPRREPVGPSNPDSDHNGAPNGEEAGSAADVPARGRDIPGRNLRANPSCRITVDGRDIPIRAEIVSEAERDDCGPASWMSSWRTRDTKRPLQERSRLSCSVQNRLLSELEAAAELRRPISQVNVDALIHSGVGLPRGGGTG